jgi:hypothetical protein
VQNSPGRLATWSLLRLLLQRQLLIYCYSLVSDNGTVHRGKLRWLFGTGNGKKNKSILVVSLDNLGDLVFASGLVQPIREQFPDAKIGLWCKAYAAGLAPLIPDVSEVYAADPFWDRSPGTGKGSLPGFVSSIASVKRARFGHAIVTSAP